MIAAPTPRPGFWEWTQVAVLVTNLVWTTLCLGGYRPETMVVTLALSGLLLTVHFAARAWGAPADAVPVESDAEGKESRPARLTSLTGAPAAERGAGRAGIAGFHPAGWLLVPFLVYAAGNVLWVTPVRWLGWRDWLGWAQMIVVFWVVLNSVRSRAARSSLLGAVLVLALGAVLLGCYQRFVQPDWLMLGRVQVETFTERISGPFGIPNSLAALILLVLPVAVGLAFRRGASATQRILFGYLAAVLALGLVLTVSRGGWLALMLVLLVWPVVGGRGSWRRRVAIAAAVAVVLVAIGTTVVRQVPIARERMIQLQRNAGELSRPILWRGAIGIWRDHQLWGGGAGSYNLAFEKYRPAGFQDEPRWAHNDYLNTLSDYGAVGFALFFGACGVIACRCAWRRGGASGGVGNESHFPVARLGRRREPGLAAIIDRSMVQQALAAGLAAFALQLWVEFHFKIPALAMTAAVIAGLWVQRRWPQRQRILRIAAPWRRRLLTGAAVATVAGTAVWAVPVYRAEALRYGARESINRLASASAPAPAREWTPVLAEARVDLQRAVEIDPGNGAAWADLSYVLALQVWAQPQLAAKLARPAGHAADRALGCSHADPEFWVRRGVALDLQRRWTEAGAAFVQALTLAPARGTVWYHHAFHLSLEPREQARAVAAVEFALRLDGGNRAAQALRERLAGRPAAP